MVCEGRRRKCGRKGVELESELLGQLLLSVMSRSGLGSPRRTATEALSDNPMGDEGNGREPYRRRRRDAAVC